jgi:hypothetical protein
MPQNKKNSHPFQANVFVINYLHLYQMDFTYEVIRDQNLDPTAQWWVRIIRYKSKFVKTYNLGCKVWYYGSYIWK